MKRKVKALLALALTLALVSTTLGDNWLYVSAENAAETEEQTDEPAAAAEEETEEKPAAPEEAAPEEIVSEETTPVEETAAVEEETAPVELVPEEKQTEEQKPEAAEAPAEQPTGAPTESPAPADEQKQPAETPAPADEQKQPVETPAEQPTESPAPAETPAADAAAPAAPAETPATDAEVPGADEKDTEIVEEETGLTEQTIEASVDTEEKDVVITLTGEMPEEATASACPVDISMDGVNIIAAYDITIYDADGQEFQPSEEKPLQVKIEDDAVRKALEENTKLEVYHLEDAEAEPEQVQEVNLEAAAVEFQAPSFSIYAVVTPEQHFTHTYQFVDEDGNPIADIQEQILSAQETLTEPKSPTKDHAVFEGWYTAQNGGEKFNKFGQQEPELEASVTTTLYARFTTVYYVYYKAERDENSKVLYTQRYSDANDSIVTDGVPFAVPAEKALIGWSTELSGDPNIINRTIDGKDWTLYPVVADAHWITFESNGGSSIDPVYVLAKHMSVKPNDPTKKGYRFDGWYLDEECTNPFHFNKELTENVTLYAKWLEAKTTVKVIYWKETLEEGTYDYAEQETVTATTGSWVSAANYQSKKNYKYFHYDSSKSDQSVNVLGDGSTVVNVRYARNIYTFDFDLNSGRYRNPTMTIGNKKYTKNSPHYQFKAKYGQDVTGIWPSAENFDSNNSSEFEGWSIDSSNSNFSSKRWTITEDMISNTDNESIQHYKGVWNYNLHQVELHYWGQNSDDDEYSEFTDYSQKANTPSGFVAKDITGFTFKEAKNENYNRWGGYYEKYNFYYTRNTYDLEFISGSTTLKTVEDIRFEKSIADQGYTPSRPSDIPSYYEFDGWYTTTDCLDGTKFDFTDANMPASNLALYAKWVPKTITVTFDMNWGTDSKPDDYKNQTLAAGTMATRPKNPAREGYTFAGWTRNGSPYNFSALLTEDTILTAQWISTAEYELKYEPGDGGTGEGFSNEVKYAEDAKAKIQDVPSAWKPKTEGEVFVCWNTATNGKGDDYYPGDEYQIPVGGATLYARWAPIRKTTLVYDYTGGMFDGKERSDAIEIAIPNSEYEIDDRIPTREGYEFRGWSITEEIAAGAALLTKGDKIQVDTLAEDSNVIYAQWRKLKEVTFTVEKLVDGNMGDHNRKFEFEYSIIDKEGAVKGSDTFKLKSSVSTELPKVAEGYTIVIQETSVTGYTTTIDATVDNASSEAGKFSYTVTKDSSDDIKVTYTNSKTMVTPTGVTTNVMTSILMILAGLGMVVVMLLTGKRRKI